MKIGLGLIIYTPPNNLLLNSYFKNPIVELHILHVLNIHYNFHQQLLQICLGIGVGRKGD